MQMSKPLMKSEGKTSDDLQLNQAQAVTSKRVMGKRKEKQDRKEKPGQNANYGREKRKWHKNPQTHGGMKRQKCRRNAQSIMEHPPQWTEPKAG